MSYIDLTTTLAPLTPAPTHVELFINSANSHLSTINSSGTVTDFGGGTVNSGTATHLSYYGSSGTALSDANGNSISGAYTFTGGAGAITLSSSTIAMGSNKITGLANGTASTDAAAFGQLKLLQTIVGTTTTQLSTASSTYANTHLTATIIPTSASNRIKITVSGALQAALNATAALLSVNRGSTEVTGGGSLGVYRNPTSGSGRSMATFVYVDSPATTGSTVYTVVLLSADNSSVVAFPSSSGETASIILEEIV